MLSTVPSHQANSAHTDNNRALTHSNSSETAFDDLFSNTLPDSPPLAGGDFFAVPAPGLSDSARSAERALTNHATATGANKLGPTFSSAYASVGSFAGENGDVSVTGSAGVGCGEFWAWLGLQTVERDSPRAEETAVDTPPAFISLADLESPNPPSLDSSLDDYSDSSSALTPSDGVREDLDVSRAYEAFALEHSFSAAASSSKQHAAMDPLDLFNQGSDDFPTSISSFPSLANATGAGTESIARSNDYRNNSRALDASLESPLYDSSTESPSFGLDDYLGDLSPFLEDASALATPALDFAGLAVDHSIGQSLFPDYQPPADISVIKEEVTAQADDIPVLSPVAVEAQDDDYSPATRSTRKRKAIAPAPATADGARSGKRILNGVRVPSLSTPPVLALDAPIQPRHYHGTSKTSRKPMPKAVARAIGRDANGRKLNPNATADDLDDALKREVDERRRQNTLAARQSRQRKAEYVGNLESENEAQRELIEQLRNDNATLAFENNLYNQRYGPL